MKVRGIFSGYVSTTVLKHIATKKFVRYGVNLLAAFGVN